MTTTTNRGEIVKLFIALILISASAAVAAQLDVLCLYSPAVVDSATGDTLQPDLVHSIVFSDTATVVDSSQWPIGSLIVLKATSWPDSTPVKKYGISEGMLWKKIKKPRVDSVEVVNDITGLPEYKKVWWLSKDVIFYQGEVLHGKYKIRGDSLVRVK